MPISFSFIPYGNPFVRGARLIFFRPYGTRGLGDTGVPTTEVVGYSLSSLTGLNLGAAQIPFSFVPTGLDLAV